MKLHLGCGTNYLEGFMNVDLDPGVRSDWCGDCNNMPSKDNTFDFIYSHHVLEHFKCLFTILDEMVRVSKNGCEWDITVPLWSWGQNQGNPYHNIYFSPETFRFFDKGKNGIYKREQRQDYSLQEISTEYNEQEINFKIKVIK